MHQRRRRDDPAQPPAGHRPCLRKAVRRNDSIIRIGQREKRRCRSVIAEIHALVDVVGDDPDTVLTAVRENRFLLCSRQRPAGRIVGRVHHQRARRRRERIEQPIEIERPSSGAEVERDARHARGEDLGNLGEIRPQRRHGDDAIIRTDQRFDRQHQRRHAGRGDGDRAGVDRAMESRNIARDRLAQLGDAEVVRIERLAASERGGRFVANERRRNRVRLAKPECQHGPIVHRGVRDVANLRCNERLDRAAGDR